MKINLYSAFNVSIFVKHWLILFTVFFTIKASSQESFINGIVCDSVTHFPVALATVSNITNKLKATTNDKGFFSMKVSVGDNFFVQAASYQFNTWKHTITSGDTILIFLTRLDHKLLDVTVTANYGKYQFDSAQRRASFDENMGKRVRTVSKANNLGFGVAINLDRFKKKYKYQKRDEKVFNFLEESAYVDYRFSPNLVAYYTKLKGEALKEYLYRYTPSYTWLRAHSAREDVILYINDTFRLYKTSAGK